MNRHAVNPQILGRCATRTSLYNYYLRVEKFIPYHAQLQLPCETGSVRAAACAALSHPSPKELWRARGAACPTRHVSGQRELARTTSRPPESERTESHSGSPHVAARPMTATLMLRASRRLVSTSRRARRAMVTAAGSWSMSTWRTADAASTVACVPTSCSTIPTCALASAGQSLRPSPTKPTTNGPRPALGSMLCSKSCARGSSCGQVCARIIRCLSAGSKPACVSASPMPTALATRRAAAERSPVSRIGRTPRPRSCCTVAAACGLRASSSSITPPTTPSTIT
mmetsp:Transcript_7753/g.24940  ORF Transcript_7753/g.24940 Transcript_7753/m.24940 type:complete len:285 (-) Transcript_7753:1733-2587(-)